MPKVKVAASLPFPLRVNTTPYVFTIGGDTWTLTVERVQRAYPDQRVAGPGTDNIDMVVDRTGQIAYSRVTGEAWVKGPGFAQVQITHSFPAWCTGSRPRSRVQFALPKPF